jgi:hypothetical protein
MIWLLSFLPIWIFQAVATGLIVLGLGVYLFVKHPVIPSFVPKLIGIAMIVVGVFVSGGLWTQREFLIEIEKAKEEIARIEKESAENTAKIEAEYKNKVVIIKEKGDVIIQKVPEYISKTSDAKCDVPNGFVVLHDSAAKNEIPNTTREFNENSSGVGLSEIATTVAGNYGTCHEVREQLKSLQDWVKEQEKIYNKP